MNPQIVVAQRIPETIVEGKRLGRHIRIDARGRNYRVKAYSRGLIESRMWHGTNDVALEQTEGSCVGFSYAQCLNCSPWGMRLTAKHARDIYALATTMDPWEGSWPGEDTGTSGLAGAQACRQLGYIKSWTNAYTLDEVLTCLQSRPGVFGTTWFAGCDEFDPITGAVDPTGVPRGGHETMIAGCDVGRAEIILRNSWGPGYGAEHSGQSGYFRLSFIEFQALLALMGDVIFPDAP